jgi:signal transduction histidine kinase
MLLVTFYSSNRTSRYLEQRNFHYVETILEQVKLSLDREYDHYALTFSEITLLDNFASLIDHPPYKSKTQERNQQARIGESTANPDGGSIRRMALTKINGEFQIIELNRRSLIYNTAFKSHILTHTNITVDYDLLFRDPLMARMLSNRERPLVFGKPEPGVLGGHEADQRPILLYGYYRDEITPVETVLLTILNDNFIQGIVNSYEDISSGTLFAIDELGKLLYASHPDPAQDYYRFDQVKKRYVLDGDSPNPEGELMNFSDYQQLITDLTVLDGPEISGIVSKIGSENSNTRHFIYWKNRRYLVNTNFADDTRIKLIHFQPVNIIRRPITNMIVVLFLFSLVLALFAIFASFFLSSLLTRPIQTLTKKAEELSAGHYRNRVDTKTLGGEFKVLGETFNQMSEQIYSHRTSLEIKVRERTSELNRLNRSLEEKSRFKSQFLANMSHELRTPLNAIINYNRFLLSGVHRSLDDLHDITKEMAEQADKNGDSLFAQILSRSSSEFMKDDGKLSNIYVSILRLMLDSPDLTLTSAQKTTLSGLIEETEAIFSGESNLEEKYLTSALSSSEYLLELINSILDISKIEAGRLELDPRPVELTAFLAELQDECRTLQSQLNPSITLISDFNCPTDITLRLDAVRVKQIILNLISNAFKYTLEGRVEFLVRYESDLLEVVVRDSGIGLTKEQLTRLYQEFQRFGDKSRIEGSGLGLALVKKLVDLHGGSIIVDSQPGEGSNFSITIPALICENESASGNNLLKE